MPHSLTTPSVPSELWPANDAAPESSRVRAPLTSRISHADELQLSCRLSECRRELTAIALLLPDGDQALRRLHAVRQSEVRAGASRNIGTPLEELDLLQQGLGELRQSSSTAVGGDEDPVEQQLSAVLALLERANLREIDVLKVVQAARLGTKTRRTSARPRVERDHAITPELRKRRALAQRAARLSSEVDRIRSRFVSANQGLVSYVVNRYIGMGLNEADLLQEANIGLMRAVDKFDHRRGSRFGTYAIWWIRQSVRRALANQSRTIRLPVHALGARYTLERTAQRLSAERGGAATADELAKSTGMLPKNVEPLLNLVKEPLSLDAPRNTEIDTPMGDSIADSITPNGLELAARNERAKQLRALLEELSVRERKMLTLRFGLDGHDECTLEQIGARFTLTRERVRQIVSSALQKLERQTELQHLDLS